MPRKFGYLGSPISFETVTTHGNCDSINWYPEGITRLILKILSIILLIAVGVVLILGIGTLFKGGETSKKYSNKLMQLRVLLQFIAIIVLVLMAYFFKN